MTVCTPLYISSEMDKMVMWNSFLHQNDWKHISALYPENFMKSKDQKKTGIAGLFAGSLELVKEGNLQIKQEKIFDDIFIKKS